MRPGYIAERCATPPDELIAEDELNAALATALVNIKPRYLKVFMARVVEEVTLREAGERIGVSTERARQMVGKVKRLLRHPYRFKPVLAALRGVLPREVVDFHDPDPWSWNPQLVEDKPAPPRREPFFRGGQTFILIDPALCPKCGATIYALSWPQSIMNLCSCGTMLAFEGDKPPVERKP